MFFGITEREVSKKGEKKGKGVERKFALIIDCQNHIPFSLCIIMQIKGPTDFVAQNPYFV